MKYLQSLIWVLDIYDYYKESTTDKVDDALDELGDDFTEEECYSYNAAKYQIYMQMKECSAVEYLFRQAQEMKEWQSRAKKAEKELKKLKSSTTLKAGKALLYIPKKLKHMTGKK